MIDIAQKTTELVQKLKQPFNGVTLHGRAQCEDDWSPDYATICNVYCVHDSLLGDSPYVSFDSDQFLRDFEEMIRDHYTIPIEDGGDIVYFFYRPPKHIPEGIIIIFREQAQELEIYRNKAT